VEADQSDYISIFDMEDDTAGLVSLYSATTTSSLTARTTDCIQAHDEGTNPHSDTTSRGAFVLQEEQSEVQSSPVRVPSLLPDTSYSPPSTFALLTTPTTRPSNHQQHSEDGGSGTDDDDDDTITISNKQSPMSALASFLSIPIEETHESEHGTGTGTVHSEVTSDFKKVRQQTTSSCGVMIDSIQLSLMASAALMKASSCKKEGNTSLFYQWMDASLEVSFTDRKSPGIVDIDLSTSWDSTSHIVAINESLSIECHSPPQLIFETVVEVDDTRTPAAAITTATTTTPIGSVWSASSYGLSIPWSPPPPPRTAASMPPEPRKFLDSLSQRLASLDRIYWNHHHQQQQLNICIPLWHPGGVSAIVALPYQHQQQQHHHGLSSGKASTARSMSHSPGVPVSSSARPTARAGPNTTPHFDITATTTTLTATTFTSNRVPVWWKRHGPPKRRSSALGDGMVHSDTSFQGHDL
jgi:hypothetical protein